MGMKYAGAWSDCPISRSRFPKPPLRKGRERALVLTSTALSPSTLPWKELIKADGISSCPSVKGRREMDHRN